MYIPLHSFMHTFLCSLFTSLAVSSDVEITFLFREEHRQPLQHCHFRPVFGIIAALVVQPSSGPITNSSSVLLLIQFIHVTHRYV
jgi:hypothetical protein